MLSAQDQSRLQSSGAVPMKRLFDRLGTIWLRLFQLNAWERPRRSLRPYCSYLATTQASRLEPNCKWTAEALILTCLLGLRPQRRQVSRGCGGLPNPNGDPHGKPIFFKAYPQKTFDVLSGPSN